MVRERLFDDVDIVLDWHPGARNAVNVGTGTAIQMVDYTFHGIAAHAAGNPDKGRSALDGVEAFNYMVNMLREHVRSEERRVGKGCRTGGAASVISMTEAIGVQAE